MARTKSKRGERCAWEEDSDGNWDTACGGKFYFTDDGPEENKFKHCCYCGAPLKVVRYVEAR